MRLTYYGHSSFLVETADGIRVILDPYHSLSFEGAIRYDPIEESADVVVASHGHDDHGAVDTISGQPLTLVHPKTEKVGRLTITGIEVAHDESEGRQRGRNTIVILDDGDIRLVHAGDLGHTLDATTVKAIGRVDVLLVPVGGFFTIDHDQAAAVADALDPRVVIPMHYKTDKISFPIAPVDAFLATQKTVEHREDAVFEVTQETLPETRATIVLAHAR